MNNEIKILLYSKYYVGISFGQNNGFKYIFSLLFWQHTINNILKRNKKLCHNKYKYVWILEITVLKIFQY